MLCTARFLKLLCCIGTILIVSAVKCPFEPAGNFLSWENSTFPCNPIEVCGKVILNQIPDVSKHLPMSMVCSSKSGKNPALPKLYDQAASRECFTNKKLCVLGDSTLEESIHDITVLLAGIGDDSKRVNEHYDDMIRARQQVNFNISDVYFRLGGSSSSGDRAHRLMDIRVPAINFTLYHHFTGHKEISQNGEGITALLYHLRGLYDSQLYNCDMLLLNSGAHDFERDKANPDCQMYPEASNSTCLQDYLPGVQSLLGLVQELYSNRSHQQTQVFWKGEAFSAGIHGFLSTAIKKDREAKIAKLFRKPTGVPIHFINITGPVGEVPFKMTTQALHHIGQSSVRSNSPMPLLWSSVSTQVIMNHLCGTV